MSKRDFDVLKVLSSLDDDTDEFSIPLDLSDLLLICQEYNKLGWNPQYQITYIAEHGVSSAIKNGVLKKEVIPSIRAFLKAIAKNAYFGDAVSQAEECLLALEAYEYKEAKPVFLSLN